MDQYVKVQQGRQCHVLKLALDVPAIETDFLSHTLSHPNAIDQELPVRVRQAHSCGDVEHGPVLSGSYLVECQNPT